jgi:hypothetical protein
MSVIGSGFGLPDQFTARTAAVRRIAIGQVAGGLSVLFAASVWSCGVQIPLCLQGLSAKALLAKATAWGRQLRLNPLLAFPGVCDPAVTVVAAGEAESVDPRRLGPEGFERRELEGDETLEPADLKRRLENLAFIPI